MNIEEKTDISQRLKLLWGKKKKKDDMLMK